MKRDTKGRFKKLSLDEVDDQIQYETRPEGIKNDLNNIGHLSYIFIRLIPFIILIWLLLRYFKIYSKVFELFVEIGCGENCRCWCNTTTAIEAIKVSAPPAGTKDDV
jgi:hypothetical protein